MMTALQIFLKRVIITGSGPCVFYAGIIVIFECIRYNHLRQPHHGCRKTGEKTMRLLNVDTVEEAREKLLDGAKDLHLKTERIPLSSALGRILAEDAGAVEPVPAFRKSTVDGYAVIGQNTQGVTDSIPVFLEVTDEISIGTDAVKRIEPGQCAYVPTGGMIPGGADAMVMVEYAEHFDDSRIAVYQSVSAGTNVIQIGEDIMKDDIFLKSGTEIRPGSRSSRCMRIRGGHGVRKAEDHYHFHRRRAGGRG